MSGAFAARNRVAVVGYAQSPIVARFDRRVRRKVASLSDLRQIVQRLSGSQRIRLVFSAPQQLQGQERGMALVQVVREDTEAERVEHSNTADAEHDLLAQPVGSITAV